MLQGDARRLESERQPRRREAVSREAAVGPAIQDAEAREFLDALRLDTGARSEGLGIDPLTRRHPRSLGQVSIASGVASVPLDIHNGFHHLRDTSKAALIRRFVRERVRPLPFDGDLTAAGFVELRA